MGAKESNRIRMFRELAGLSQKALAEKVGTSQQQIQRIESGKQSIRHDLALQICAAINAPRADVFPKTRSVVRKLKAAAGAQRVRSSKARSLPTSKALLVDATNLELWAKRLDAYARLPQLVRRLALNTLPAIERIQFRSEEGVRLGGWDGIIQTAQSNGFVPAGISGWEMGTSADVKGKADEDYAKRLVDPLGLDLASSTFVFVTPRRWKAKEKWAETRRREGIWKDVRALDADDLAAWLEQAPSAHIWFSMLLGKRPSGVQDLQSFWETWSGATRPPLCPDLLVAGRTDAVKAIQQFLKGPPSVIGLQSETRDEAVAFFAATIHGLPENERETALARGIVVEQQSSWGVLVPSTHPLILIPNFPGSRPITDAVNTGHSVVVPLGKDEAALRETIQLPRLRREEAKKALVTMGLTDDRAGDLSVLARRSVAALRRKLAISPSVLTPKWAAPDIGRSLLPALLAGRWSDRNLGDQEALAHLAGREYPQLQEFLIRWANEHDAPVRRVGDTWMFISKEDGWSLLARYVTRHDLERFEVLVQDVLGEQDPRYDLPVGERWQANIKGKTLKRSSLLQEGLAETLAVMGAFSDAYPIDGPGTGQEWADRIVRQLFEKATDWHLWASLSPHLRSLAEASPESFLSAVENGLSDQDPALAKIFVDTGNNFMESSPHTGLLWSLEVLAWLPEHLGQVALFLAKLARLDPGVKIMNKPINSLKEIFLCWHPGTTAVLEQRLRVLDTIRKREPAVAWDLLSSLLPQSHDIATPTAKPNWRDWIPEQTVPITWAEIFRATEAIIRRLLEDVGADGSRWGTVIDNLGNLRKAEFDAVVDQLQGLDPNALNHVDRVRIWSSLQHIISLHLQHPEANWVLPQEAINRLQKLYGTFEPNDLVIKYAWLFSHHPDLPEAGYSEWQERDKALAARRLQAVEELVEKGGQPMILELANQTQLPRDVGYALGKSPALANQESELLTQCLGSANAKWRDVGFGFLFGRASVKGQDWLDALRVQEAWKTWTPQQRADYFRCLPLSNKATWDALNTEEAETQRLYWTQIGIWEHRELQADQCEQIVLKLAEHGRLATTVDFMALCILGNKAGIRPQLIAEVLQQVIKGGNTEAVDWHSLSHDLGELLDFLEKSGEIPESQLAQFEWYFLPFFRHFGRLPKMLHKALAEDPEFFLQILTLMYRAEGEEPPEVTEDNKVRAHLAFNLLHRWSLPPGLNDDNTVSPDKLRLWVTKARELATTSRRGTVADHHIGNVLIHYPAGVDGAWPHEALRDFLEELASEDIEDGIRMGIFNSRGVVSRAIGEGGTQERAIADRYNGFARLLSDGWPRTARLMKKIAQGYESDARREDIDAEIQEDLWD